MKPTQKQILEIQGTDPRYVTRSQLSGLTREQVSWLTRSQVSWLSREQVSWLSRSQVSWLTRSQVSWLTGEQLRYVTLKDIPTLKRPYTKILARIQNDGKLEMATWHTCKTTHCVGGWTIIETPGGKELEAKHGTALAAELILRASRPEAPLPNFTASNEAAMAFIEARAAEETV